MKRERYFSSLNLTASISVSMHLGEKAKSFVSTFSPGLLRHHLLLECCHRADTLFGPFCKHVNSEEARKMDRPGESGICIRISARSLASFVFLLLSQSPIILVVSTCPTIWGGGHGIGGRTANYSCDVFSQASTASWHFFSFWERLSVGSFHLMSGRGLALFFRFPSPPCSVARD